MAELTEKLFGSDGFRGPYDSTDQPGRMNPVTIYDLAYTYADLAAEITDSRPTVVVGGDTRTSTPELMDAASHGAAAAGAEVWQVGVAPTPAIGWIAQRYQTHAIAITASHNPDHDNGFKVFCAGGVKPDRATLDEVEARYWEYAADSPPLPVTGADDNIHNQRPLTELYLKALTERLGGPDVLQDKLVVVDGANGAASELAPRLYRALGADVVRFACNPQGVINGNCGAANLGGLQRFLKEREDLANDPRLLAALANDGDSDRVMGVDHHGRIINGNHWMDMLADEGQAGIVGTIYTNTVLRRTVMNRGVEFHECDNGDSNVTARLHELTRAKGAGYTRGGEFSGHLIDTEWLPSGDGLLMGGAMAVRLATRGETLADVYESLPLWPERLDNIRTGTRNAKELVASEDVQAAKAELEQRFGAVARILLRASGTEPLVRIWAEAAEKSLVDDIVDSLAGHVRRLTGSVK